MSIATSTRTVKLKAVGDIMLGDHPVCFGHGVRSTIEEKGLDFLLKEVEIALKDTDILFGNLESVLSDAGYNSSSMASAELRGRPEDAMGLSRSGFNLINLANNHALQHGRQAFKDTVKNLSNQSIKVVGLGKGARCETLRLVKNDIEIVFLGYSLRPEKYSDEPAPYLYANANEETILAHVNELRLESESQIVVSLHWGEEYLNYPSKKQISFARDLVDSGACLIIGHHPHVLQGIEEYKGAIILYSLGNFIFDKWQRNPRETAIFSCEIGANGVSNIEVTPVLISRSFQPKLASGKEKIKILNNIEKYSASINRLVNRGEREMSFDEIRYQKMADQQYFKFRVQSYIYFLTHIHKYTANTIFYSLFRSILRRLGRK